MSPLISSTKAAQRSLIATNDVEREPICQGALIAAVAVPAAGKKSGVFTRKVVDDRQFTPDRVPSSARCSIGSWKGFVWLSDSRGRARGIDESSGYIGWVGKLDPAPFQADLKLSPDGLTFGLTVDEENALTFAPFC